MKKEEIEQVAINSYQTYFHDQKVESQHQDVDRDIILDKEKLTQDINSKKVDEEKKHESLEVLREKLTQEAENSFENVFGETKEVSQTHKMNTTEMYEELSNERKHLSEIANELKEKQIIKMKH